MTVTLERVTDDTVCIRLNRPERLNALNYDLVTDLHDALDTIAADEECKVAILTEAGRGITYLLPRLIGAARAFDLIVTGRTVDADEAERMGIVSRVVPDESLWSEATQMAESIAAYTAFGLRNTKEVMWLNLDVDSMPAAIALENRNQELAAKSDEVRTYMSSYAKRHRSTKDGSEAGE